MSVKIIKSVLVFNENQKIAPRFLLTYVLIWLFWHNQLFTTFFTSDGDFLARANAALASVADNQYILVFFFTCLFFGVRIGYHFLKEKADDLMEEGKSTETEVGSDQGIAKSADIQRLMTMISELKVKLANSKEKEEKVIKEKNTTISKLLSLQAELDDMKADNTLLEKANARLKAQLVDARTVGINSL
ncbi:hypothetical protein Sps_04550 [Shewanella psychrophila]|uniref:Uncharacterized protein n=1 Tax=Shewanella psychrophila TaxID=225848 RepID=A0A1S6HVP6_9GAMM|nr:hypothetical protein [Shewanella psychrophila]AQS39635.1 hypothetical protein Sps_04550 [Shewanella psychrophila]